MPRCTCSASPDLVGFGGRAYQRHSPNTSGLLVQLFEGLQAEGFAMPFTMEGFHRQFVKEHFPKLTRKEREDVMKSLPPEERKDVLELRRGAEISIAAAGGADVGLSAGEASGRPVRGADPQYLDRLSAERPAPAQATAENVRGCRLHREAVWERDLLAEP